MDVARGLRATRSRAAGTAVALLTCWLCVQGADWSAAGLRTWAWQKANSSVRCSLPLTGWQLEVGCRLVRPPATPVVASLPAWLAAHPVKAQLMGVGLLTSPRWSLLLGRLADGAGLQLVHDASAAQQARALRTLAGLARAVSAKAEQMLASENTAAAPLDGQASPLLLQSAAGWLAAWLPAAAEPAAPAAAPAAPAPAPAPTPAASLGARAGASLAWWAAWLLCPGLQAAAYMAAAASPPKAAYALVIGVLRTGVELAVAAKAGRALAKANRAALASSVLCCYLLPLVISAQSLAVLLLFAALSTRILAIAAVAFCLWGPPVILALMTTSWQPQRGNRFGERPGQQAAGPGLARPAFAAAAGGAVDAVAALVAAAPGSGAAAKRPADGLHWPPPLLIPAELEDAPVPSHLVCGITRCVMSEPAVTATGASYERAALLEWLATQRRDPLTSRELRPEQVAPNLALYGAVEAWVAAEMAARLQAKPGRAGQDAQQQPQDAAAAAESDQAPGSG